MTRYEIELTDLTKSFRTVEAVRVLSFTVRSGAVTAFPEPNGARLSGSRRAAAMRCWVLSVRKLAACRRRYDALAAQGQRLNRPRPRTGQRADPNSARPQRSRVGSTSTATTCCASPPTCT